MSGCPAKRIVTIRIPQSVAFTQIRGKMKKQLESRVLGSGVHSSYCTFMYDQLLDRYIFAFI